MAVASTPCDSRIHPLRQPQTPPVAATGHLAAAAGFTPKRRFFSKFSTIFDFSITNTQIDTRSLHPESTKHHHKKRKKIYIIHTSTYIIRESYIKTYHAYMTTHIKPSIYDDLSVASYEVAGVSQDQRLYSQLKSFETASSTMSSADGSSCHENV